MKNALPISSSLFYQPKNVRTEVRIMKPAKATQSGMKHVCQRVCTYNKKLFANLNSSKDLQYKC